MLSYHSTPANLQLFVVSPLIDMYYVPTVSSSIDTKAFIEHQLWARALKDLFSNGHSYGSPHKFVHSYLLSVCSWVPASFMETPALFDQSLTVSCSSRTL